VFDGCLDILLQSSVIKQVVDGKRFVARFDFERIVVNIEQAQVGEHSADWRTRWCCTSISQQPASRGRLPTWWSQRSSSGRRSVALGFPFKTEFDPLS